MRLLFLGLLFAASLHANSFFVMTEELKPYNYTKHGKLTGMSTQLVRQVMQDLNIDADIKVYPWSRALRMLQTKENAVLFSMAKTPQREKKYRFACPLRKAQVYLFYKKGTSPPISKHKLHGFTIGVVQDFGAHQRLQKIGHEKFDFSSSTKKKVQKLLLDRVDLIAGTPEAIYSLGGSYDVQKIVQSSVKLYETTLCIAFNKAVSKREVNRWQRRLRKLHQNGTAQQIFDTCMEQKQ